MVLSVDSMHISWERVGRLHRSGFGFFLFFCDLQWGDWGCGVWCVVCIIV